jgi:hypothetical protein
MLIFFGFDLELVVERVVTRRAGPATCCARDFAGGRWLIVQVDDDPAHLAWVCAPVSERAMQAVVDGHAAAWDAIRHSITGTVELVAVEQGRAVPDRCLLCAQIPDAQAASPDWRVTVGAGRQATRNQRAPISSSLFRRRSLHRPCEPKRSARPVTRRRARPTSRA